MSVSAMGKLDVLDQTMFVSAIVFYSTYRSGLTKTHMFQVSSKRRRDPPPPAPRHSTAVARIHPDVQILPHCRRR